nr:hypothetical protein [Tanacetum cinerariifolium]
NQGRGLQVTQSVEDTHVILTPVNPDDPQKSSSMSSFVSSMLNPLSDEGVESIFMTTSSQIISLEPPTPIMTPSTISTITTSGEAPIPPPTIPSIILENLPTFNSAFRFEERLRLLETSFYEYRQTNQFANAVSVIPGIVHQYMDQQIKEAAREAVQIQTDQLQDSLQRENDEFLRNIDENMKNVLKGLVKNQVKEQVSRILPRVEESVNATLEAELTYQKWNSRRSSLKRWKEISLSSDPMNNKTFTRRADDQPIVQTLQHPEWFSQPRKPPLPNRAWNTALPAAQGDAQSWISDLAKQADARSSFNELLDTPIDFSNFIMHRLNVDTLTPDLLAGPTY